MSGFDAAARDLFERVATDLYEVIVEAGGISADDPRLAEDDDRRKAFELMVELGLLTRPPGSARWVAVEPTSAQSRVVSPLGSEVARILDESAHWARAFQSLSHSWKKLSEGGANGHITYLRGTAIRPYLTTIVADAEKELLTAQPQAGRDPATLVSATMRDTEALARGVSMRTLYQHSARRHPATHKYVAQVSRLGAEVRTLDEFFNRMIVVDGRTAVIPAADDDGTAVAIREPAVVRYLVDVFERAWARARPFTTSETSMLREIAVEQRAMTIRMLIEGHSDTVGAKRVGVSPRTYAGYVAELKAEYACETRFQLGYRLGQLGISGQELPES